jgi:hypothetical protein
MTNQNKHITELFSKKRLTRQGVIKKTSSDFQNQINRLEIISSMISKIKNKVFVFVKFFMLFLIL